jgi:acyl-CoA thioester hydrolase
MATHVAFIHGEPLDEIVAGRKHFEFSLSFRGLACRSAREGDRLLLKRSGGEVNQVVRQVLQRSPVIGLVVETQCRFFKPLTFPDTANAGLRVARLGRSSVRYEIGLFRNEDDTAAAQGHFVHVYVERETRKATALPPEMRAALGKILVSE